MSEAEREMQKDKGRVEGQQTCLKLKERHKEKKVKEESRHV